MDEGLCGFVAIAQHCVDSGLLSLSDFVSKYGDVTDETAAKAFSAEWVAINESGLSGDFATAMSQTLSFTKEFGGDFSKYTLDTLKSGAYEGIALTPESIAHHLSVDLDKTKIGKKFSKATFTLGTGPNNIISTIDDLWKSTTDNQGQGIYGLFDSAQKKVEHYVYIDSMGNLMTWGRENEAAKKALKEDDFVAAYVKIKATV